MDVRCGRCGTEYDFDDALISERGTTVKCTNCGYQFKVYPAEGSGVPERWMVRTAVGRDLVFTTLRDLQKGIARGQVGPDDLLSRGVDPPRRLGDIAELEPFLRQRALHTRRNPSTLHGVAPPTEVPVPPAAGGSAAGTTASPAAAPDLGSQAAPPGGEAREPMTSAPRRQPTTIIGGIAVPDQSAIRAPEAPPVQAPAAETTGARAPRPEPANKRQRTGTLLGGLGVPEELRDAPQAGSHAPAQKTPSLKATEVARPPSIATPGRPASVASIDSLRSIPNEAVTRSASDQSAQSVASNTSPEHVPAQATSRVDPFARTADAQPSEAEPARSRRDVSPPVDPRPTEIDDSGGASQARFTTDDRQSPLPFTPAPSDVRESMRSYDELHTDPRYVPVHSTRHARSRWIVAVVVLAAGGLFAATVGRKYLARFAAEPRAEVQPAERDARVRKMLESGQQLLEDGDLEGAKEQFDKATVLAEKDPEILKALAGLETLRADLIWLRLRLLDPEDQQRVRATHRELGRLVGRAQRAVDDAFRVAPEDPAVIRARVNGLRLAGELAKARNWVAPLSDNASVPENAYVLAALDLAESKPVWESVISRLRTAAAAERQLGRARVALIYALARSGEVARAQGELDKLERSNKTHPLLPDLREFVARHGAAEDAGADGGETATVDPTKLPGLDTRDRPERELRDGERDNEKFIPGDFRTQLEMAARASEAGDLDRAEDLYHSVLKKRPGNTEAMAGLAEIAKRRNDPDKAAKMYDKVLQKNPTYLPALVASADQKWAAGDRRGAVDIYQRVLEQVGPGTTYGQHAARRIDQARRGVPDDEITADEKPESANGSTGSSPPPTSNDSAAPEDVPETEASDE